jgi:hypothetical protein
MTYLALDTHAVLTLQQVRRALPHMSIPPGADLSAHGYALLHQTPAPEALPAHRVEPASPEQGEDGQWRTAWTQVPLTADEIAQQQRALQESIVAQTQQRLDDFARTRGYDGILSAATYATSTSPKFAAEGQCCVEARDATWACLYAILAEVEAGQRAAPSSFADIENELPPLVWPDA